MTEPSIPRFSVSDSLFRKIVRRMTEIVNRLEHRDGSPIDPKMVSGTLQAIIENRMARVGHWKVGDWVGFCDRKCEPGDEVTLFGQVIKIERYHTNPSPGIEYDGFTLRTREGETFHIFIPRFKN